MKSRTFLTKKDLIVTIFCIIFMLLNIAAVSGGGRKHAKELLCASNLRQWGIIFQSFANDNNGTFMGGWQGIGEQCTPLESQWMGALMPYYGEDNYQLLCCPTATNPESPTVGSVASGTFATWGPFEASPPLWNVPDGCYGSYGINSWVCNPTAREGGNTDCMIPFSDWLGYGNNSSPYWKTPNVKDAGSIPCFLDAIYLCGWPHHFSLPPEFEETAWLEYDSQTSTFNVNRHEGAVNAVYLDGSVRRIGLKLLWYQKWHRYYDFNEVLPLDSPDWPEWMQDFE